MAYSVFNFLCLFRWAQRYTRQYSSQMIFQVSKFGHGWQTPAREGSERAVG